MCHWIGRQFSESNIRPSRPFCIPGVLVTILFLYGGLYFVISLYFHAAFLSPYYCNVATRKSLLYDLVCERSVIALRTTIVVLARPWQVPIFSKRPIQVPFYSSASERPLSPFLSIH